MTAYTFDQLITFTRTSAATYVGSNGLVAVTPASRNLLTYTQEFDNAAWTKNGTTITANAAVAPDGTSTADKLVETATTGVHNAGRTITTTAVPYTWSCYIKAAERTFALLYHTQTNASVSIDLTTGATGTASGTVAPTSSSVTSVGNGWYRVAMTVTATAASNFFGVYTATSLSGSASYTGDDTSGFYIWGAQLEAASSASTYTRNNGGVYPPRFDYDPVTRAPRGILIEEQRTNLLLRSEEFDNASWVKENAGVGSVPTVTPNAGVAPDGNTTADRVQFALNGGTTTTDRSTLRQLVTATAAAHTFSFWVRSFDGVSTYQIQVRDQLGTGAPLTVTGAWQRVTLTNTYTAGPASIGLDLRGGQTPANSNVADILIWGAQLEAGSFATSYIPTVASQVTRTADVAAITAPMFAPWYNQSEGTFVVEATPAAVNSGFLMSLEGATTADTIDVRMNSGSFDLVVVVSSSVVVDTAGFAATAGAVAKASAAYKINDYAFCVGGAAVQTDTSASVPAVQSLYLGRRSLGNNFNGHIRSIDYYPTRLTNAQIQALTA